MRQLLIVVVVVSAGSFGCEGDEQTSSETASLVVEGSPEAAALLSFLNSPEASFELLDTDVGLDTRAARNIAAHVQGVDATYGTADDDLFESIAELDDTSYVGGAAIDKIAAYLAELGAAPSLIIEDVPFTESEAAAVVALANTASHSTLDVDVGLDSRAATGLVDNRPFSDILVVSSVAYVGTNALAALRAYAIENPDSPGPGLPMCSGGNYDGIPFTADEECTAIDFMNRARYSQMAALSKSARYVAYDCHPVDGGGAACGYRTSSWSSLGAYASSTGVSGAGMSSLKSASASWIDDGLSYDTIAQSWADRSELYGVALTLENVYVTQYTGRVSDGAYDYACVEARDTASDANWMNACIVCVGGDGATECQSNCESCIQAIVGGERWLRGTVRTSAVPGFGGYKINLIDDGKPAHPGLP